jgi:glucose/arabinose dehydrogenase
MIGSLSTQMFDRHPASVSALLIVVLAIACAGPQPSGSTSSPTSSAQPTSTARAPLTSIPTQAPTTSEAPTRATGAPTSAPATPAPTAAATPTPGSSASTPIALTVDPVADDFGPLTFVTGSGDGSGDLYVVEQEGIITILRASGDRTSFLDISDRVGAGGERGLLGLAFHPDFASNGRYFVNYTDKQGNTVVSEFGAGASTERVLLTIEQPFPNHNGGMLAFGSDGYLYIGTGDGGAGGDPQGNGQALGTLLGKILRIDVDSGDPYGIPADNPFIDSARPEIWDLGMRNPWRFSFDRETGAMFIGDVGQGDQEEIDVEAAGDGGHNYGWNTMEGNLCFRTQPCDQTGLTLPVYAYDRGSGECAVTGGYVYRGAEIPELVGRYVFSDYCTGELWIMEAATALADGVAEAVSAGPSLISPTSFGEDDAGELYIVSGAGQLVKIVRGT